MISRVCWTCLLAAVALACGPHAWSQIGGVADAKKRTGKRYCTPAYHPRGCIKVPPTAIRDAGVDPQDHPKVVVGGVGGGIGGGDDQTRERGALDWASGFTGSLGWAYRSERFVEEAYGEHGQYASPVVALRKLHVNHGPPEAAPPGTLMLFRAAWPNRYLGHVGLSVGGGAMLSALDEVRRTDVSGTPYWKDIYVGWARAPRRWRGRVPQPFGFKGPGVTGVTIVNPAFDAPLTGRVVLAATAPAGKTIAFAAYYSDDPSAGVGPIWHRLGPATDSGGTQVLTWDTTVVRDQGDSRLSTVTVAAIVVDAASGKAEGVGDFQRVSVHNGVP